MGRPKGFKLSAEQKSRMQAGRQLKKEKAREGLIDISKPVKNIKKNGFTIIGYGWNKNEEFIFPIFKSEIDTYKRKIYITMDDAIEAHNRFLAKEQINA